MYYTRTYYVVLSVGFDIFVCRVARVLKHQINLNILKIVWFGFLTFSYVEFFSDVEFVDFR